MPIWLRLVGISQAVLGIVRGVVDFVAIVLLCVMTFLILFQILGRYVFNYSISWSEEAAIFAQVWLVMLGAGIAMRNRHHVGVDFLIARCPPLVRQLARSASFLLGVWFLIVVIVGSFSLIGIGFMLKSAALQIPMAVPYFALPVGMSYFLLEFAIAVLPEIRDPNRPSTVEEGVSE
ncbi:TRAP transporter small permease [Chelativorans xinjiangense]|uniref:TRAP transporter small permease n=1 Tax=Chelativorans xinjiangense TaxID=2681485 RepID=UPI001358DD11|nr:TRAP transporter small permease [Chelativorans xinjiangense]